MIVYRRMGLAFGEAFYEPIPSHGPKVDILRLTTDSVLPDIAAPPRRSDTLIIDLSLDEEALFGGMDKTTRYEVRRAIDKDKTLYELDATCSVDDVRLFCDYYDRFAASKKRKPVFRKRLKVLAEQGVLILARSEAADGEVLVWHAYLRCTDRVVLLYSASLFRENEDGSHRNLVGRANRFAHWNDIVAAKRMGCTTYDLGGIDVSGRSSETSNIAQFKRGFGGSVVPVYAHVFPKSLAGRAVYKALGLLGVGL